jgi:pentatricopeptide repeat protein
MGFIYFKRASSAACCMEIAHSFQWSKRSIYLICQCMCSNLLYFTRPAYRCQWHRRVYLYYSIRVQCRRPHMCTMVLPPTSSRQRSVDHAALAPLSIDGRTQFRDGRTQFREAFAAALPFSPSPNTPSMEGHHSRDCLRGRSHHPRPACSAILAPTIHKATPCPRSSTIHAILTPRPPRTPRHPCPPPRRSSVPLPPPLSSLHIRIRGSLGFLASLGTHHGGQGAWWVGEMGRSGGGGCDGGEFLSPRAEEEFLLTVRQVVCAVRQAAGGEDADTIHLRRHLISPWKRGHRARSPSSCRLRWRLGWVQHASPPRAKAGSASFVYSAWARRCPRSKAADASEVWMFRAGTRRLACGWAAWNLRDFLGLLVWNLIMGGYAKFGEFEESLSLLVQMHELGIAPDEHAISCLLKCITCLSCARDGLMAHGYIVKLGFGAQCVVCKVQHD